MLRPEKNGCRLGAPSEMMRGSCQTKMSGKNNECRDRDAPSEEENGRKRRTACAASQPASCVYVRSVCAASSLLVWFGGLKEQQAALILMPKPKSWIQSTSPHYTLDTHPMLHIHIYSAVFFASFENKFWFLTWLTHSELFEMLSVVVTCRVCKNWIRPV